MALGNIHAVRHVLPVPIEHPAGRPVQLRDRHVPFSTIGIVLVFTGAVRFPSSILPLLLVSTALWLGLFAISGWINSGGGESPGIRRVWDVIAAVLWRS